MTEGSPIPDRIFHEKRTVGAPFAISIEGEKHPNEDRFFAQHPVYIVTDGVTRVQSENGDYPNPSGAALAAEAVAVTTGLFLLRQSNYSTELLVEALRRGNDAVRELNIAHDLLPGKKLDFFEHDYYSTCAAIAVVHDGMLYWATIGDNQIAVFSSKDFPSLITENSVMPLERIRDTQTFESKKERAAFWRKRLRNKPHESYATYGTLTGEPEAMAYVHSGFRPLSRGDLGIIFSDGFAHHIMDAEFRELLRKNPSKEAVASATRAFRETYKTKHNGNDLPKGNDDKTLISFIIS